MLELFEKFQNMSAKTILKCITIVVLLVVVQFKFE